MKGRRQAHAPAHGRAHGSSHAHVHGHAHGHAHAHEHWHAHGSAHEHDLAHAHARPRGLAAHIRAAAVWPLRIYQRYLSPLKGTPSCRFQPTCSSYAIEAIEVHGVLKGSLMGIWRVLRCHPFHPGGYDPVPAPSPRGSRNYQTTASKNPDVSTEAP